MDTCESSTIVECHRCEGRIESAYNEDDNGQQGGARKNHLCMKYVEKVLDQRKRALDAAINIQRLVTAELEVPDGQAYLEP